MNKATFFYSKQWQYLTGATENIYAKHRVFNTVCIFSFIGIVISVLFNAVYNLRELALIQCSFLVLQAVVFYMSRVRKAYTSAYVIYAIGNYLFLSVNYIYNAGLTGPTLLAFFLSFQCLSAVTPSRMIPVWVVCHIAVASLLAGIQYLYPEMVKYGYSSRWSQFADIGGTFYITVLISYFITSSVRNRFKQERIKVVAQKEIIEEKNRRLEYIDSERNRLFSIIAHDLRSPLTTIHGYLDILTTEGLEERERVEMEKQLLNLSTHTSEMLNNLLKWSKNQLQTHSVLLETVFVAEALENTIEVQRSVAQKKGVTLLVNIPHTTTIYANKDFIDVVVRNLLSNAIKFTPRGGVVEISADTENGTSTICIQDNGMGISDAQKPYIFNSEIKPLIGTDNEKGIGLGLVLCKEFVEKQGGRINFESKENVGTRFTVRLAEKFSIQKGNDYARKERISSK